MLPTMIEKEIALKAFKSQRENMLELFCFCLPGLANSFYTKSLIPEQILEKACNECQNKKIACIELLNCLQGRIACNSSLFHDIVQVLQSADKFLKQVPEDLVTTYNSKF